MISGSPGLHMGRLALAQFTHDTSSVVLNEQHGEGLRSRLHVLLSLLPYARPLCAERVRNVLF